MKEVFKNMSWRVPEYSKNKVKKAGYVVIAPDADINSDKYQESLKVIDNWRASHGYPLYVIGRRLKKMIKNKESFVVYRLKRLDSIVNKLKRNKDMGLNGMQDIGGCRVVVPTVNDVYEFSNAYENSRVRHKLCKENDYIKNPKKDGYRCLHRVYKYVSDDINSPYNDMRIEIQFRTLMQHYWATAVETMGICTKTNLKAGMGDENIKRFFVLASNLFAMSEGQTLVPNTSGSLKETIMEITEIDNKFHIINKLKAISTTARHISINRNSASYYLLELDLESFKLNIYGYKLKDFKFAVEDYDKLENSKQKSSDVVLVSASSIKELKSAYPNYFGDIRQFIAILENLMNMYKLK